MCYYYAAINVNAVTESMSTGPSCIVGYATLYTNKMIPGLCLQSLHHQCWIQCTLSLNEIF